MIHSPKLPPKMGFVEKELSDGTRVYEKIPESKEYAELSEKMESVTTRSEFIEDCIAEMAMQVYGGV